METIIKGSPHPRRNKPHGTGQCSKCPNPRDRPGRYCKACHAAYVRAWRVGNPMTEEQRVKDRARAMANVYKSRGKIIQQPCADCGDPKSQMHHEDYAKPLEVIWVCRRCHLARHKMAERQE